MVQKIVKWTAAIALIGLIIPQAVQAAAGSFSSNSTAVPAVRGQNTNGSAGAKGVEGYASAGGSALTYGVFGTSRSTGGIGVFGQNLSGGGLAWGVKGQSNSPTARAIEGYANSTSSTGSRYGVIGAANGPSDGATGVFGWARGSAGNTVGVFGESDSADGLGALGVGDIGVIGFGNTIGVGGISNAIGDGSYGLNSGTDVGVSGHLVGGGSNLAGTCTVLSSESSHTCTFQTMFRDTIGAPIVVLTPAEDPGASGPYWVTLGTDIDGNFTGFVVHTTANPASDLTFNFIVAGIDTTGLSVTSPARAIARAAKHDRRP